MAQLLRPVNQPVFHNKRNHHNEKHENRNEVRCSLQLEIARTKQQRPVFTLTMILQGKYFTCI